MSPAQRREMVDWEYPSVSITRQCELLGVSRFSLYYRPRAASEEDLSLMGEIDQQYRETPYYCPRRMKAWLAGRDTGVPEAGAAADGRHGAAGLCRRPSSSRRSPEHPVYPYLLRNARITLPKRVWASDITCLPMCKPLAGDGALPWASSDPLSG